MQVKPNDFCLLFAVLAIWMLSGVARAQEDPTWYVTAKIGVYEPDLAQWERFYGSKRTPNFGFGLNYQPWPTLSFGVNAHVAQDRGQAYLQQNDKASGRAEIEIFPASVEATWHGDFVQNQLWVPYVGFGWVRVGYRGRISTDSNLSVGSVDGSIWRVGLKWDMNHLDTRSARRAFENYGVDRTYLTFEFASMQAEEALSGVDVDLGGSQVTIGVAIGF